MIIFTLRDFKDLEKNENRKKHAYYDYEDEKRAKQIVNAGYAKAITIEKVEAEKEPKQKK